MPRIDVSRVKIKLSLKKKKVEVRGPRNASYIMESDSNVIVESATPPSHR